MIIEKFDEKLSFTIVYHDTRIFYILKGRKGACVVSDWLSVGLTRYNINHSFDFNYHTKIAQYEGQEQQNEMCEFLDNEQECFCDGRNINNSAKRPNFDILEFLLNEYECLK